MTFIIRGISTVLTVRLIVNRDRRIAACAPSSDSLRSRKVRRKDAANDYLPGTPAFSQRASRYGPPTRCQAAPSGVWAQNT